MEHLQRPCPERCVFLTWDELPGGEGNQIYSWQVCKKSTDGSLVPEQQGKDGLNYKDDPEYYLPMNPSLV